jgi:hypothetical protein
VTASWATDAVFGSAKTVETNSARSSGWIMVSGSSPKDATMSVLMKLGQRAVTRMPSSQPMFLTASVRAVTAYFGQVDDTARTARTQMRQSGPYQAKRSLDVDFPHLVERLVGKVLEASRIGDTSIVDQAIERSEPGDCCLNPIVARLGVGRVEVMTQKAVVWGRKHSLKRGYITGAATHVVARGEEATCQRISESAIRAGHHHCAAVSCKHERE